MKTKRLSPVDIKTIEKVVSRSSVQLFDNKVLALSNWRYKAKSYSTGYNHQGFNPVRFTDDWGGSMACSGASPVPLCCSGELIDFSSNWFVGSGAVSYRDRDTHNKTCIKGAATRRDHTSIEFFCNEVAPMGSVVVFDKEDERCCKVPRSKNDFAVIGVLLNDVVNVDLCRNHLNWHKQETQIGGKVEILVKGEIVAHCNGNPSPGDSAYYTKGGVISAIPGSPSIGRFLSSKDSQGFVKVRIDC